MFCCYCGTAILPEANYFHECGSRIINQRNGDFENNLPNIIESYFNRGYQYTEIVGQLEKYHGVTGVTITLRTLKRKLREYGLRRRGNNYDEVTVRELITREMQDAGRLGGYRYMWHVMSSSNIQRLFSLALLPSFDFMYFGLGRHFAFLQLLRACSFLKLRPVQYIFVFTFIPL